MPFSTSAALLAALALPAGSIPVAPSNIAAGADGGAGFRVFNAAGGISQQGTPFGANYGGGVRVALGDVTGDGVPDVIAAPGPGLATVHVFDGRSGALFDSVEAFEAGFAGGVYVAAGDVNGDGRADVIVGSGPAVNGGPRVRVFDGRSGVEIRSFFAFASNFAGGVTVAAGDVNGDGLADLVVGAATTSSLVKVFDGASGAELRSFFAYTGFNGGVHVAAGDVNGDGRDDIVTGAGPGGGPHVKVFSGADLQELASFFAFAPAFSGGVRVATADLDGDHDADLVAGAGPGGTPTVARFLSPGAVAAGSMMAFDAGFTGGVFVAGLVEESAMFQDGFE